MNICKRMMMSGIAALLVLSVIWWGEFAAAAVDVPLRVELQYVSVGVVAGQAASVPSADEQRVLVVVLEPHEGYYAYAHGSDAGKPTQVNLLDGAGQTVAAAVRYPQGSPQPDVFSGKPVQAYVGATPVFVSLPAAGTGWQVRISLLLCSAAHCIPVDMVLPLPALPAASSWTPLAQTPWQAAWRSAELGVPSQYELNSTKETGETAGATTALAPLPLVPLGGSVPAASAMALPGTTGGSLPLVPFGGTRAAETAATPGAAVSPAAVSGAQMWEFSPRTLADAAEPADLGRALLWGLLAGLVLNAMPCVLPVITLKMSTLLGAAGDVQDSNRVRRFREHNLYFAAGVMSWFVLLAGVVGGLELTWGGLFQYSGIVIALAVLVCLLSLSMLDVFTLPVIDLKAGISGSPRAQAYFTGLTATLLATPCSGPLLGGVLAWSAMQPVSVLLLVFVSTGLGMASPYLAFAIWPGAVRLLPRPGPWLGVLERCVGVFLLGTALYLLSILQPAAGLLTGAALAVAAAVMVWRRWRRAPKTLGLALGTVVVAAALMVWVVGLPAASTPGQVAQPVAVGQWEPFVPQNLRDMLGKEPILLEFTADWCPNCKVLELTTLSPERLRDWATRYGLRLVQVDMTRSDPEAQALLRALGSISIPLTAIFPPGSGASSPMLLRDIYTADRLDAALAATLDSPR